jgi:hypothetical protein
MDVAFYEIIEWYPALKVEEIPGTTPTKLRISGGTSKDWKSVTSITTRVRGEAIVILVHTYPSKPGTSGDFENELAVPDSVNEVRFGNGERRVWQRGVLPTK